MIVAGPISAQSLLAAKPIGARRWRGHGSSGRTCKLACAPSILAWSIAASIVCWPALAATKSQIQIEPPVQPRAWQFIVLHHTAAPRGDVAGIDADHRRRKDSTGRPWLGIGYHFVIGNGLGMADGAVESTFRWRRQLHGAHAGDRLRNEQGIGICLVGDFNKTAPTERQMWALTELVRSLADRFGIERKNIMLHRDVVATDCPGRQFPRLAPLENPPSPK